jgi:hypothetical protein
VTADELAAEIYRQQGYLVIATQEPRSIGEKIVGMPRSNACEGTCVTAALYIVAQSDEKEFARQNDIARSIVGEIMPLWLGRHFYRVESD